MTCPKYRYRVPTYLTLYTDFKSVISGSTDRRFRFACNLWMCLAARPTPIIRAAGLEAQHQPIMSDSGRANAISRDAQPAASGTEAAAVKYNLFPVGFWHQRIAVLRDGKRGVRKRRDCFSYGCIFSFGAPGSGEVYMAHVHFTCKVFIHIFFNSSHF